VFICCVIGTIIISMLLLVVILIKRSLSINVQLLVLFVVCFYKILNLKS
jgi:hypothetical protein